MTRITDDELARRIVEVLPKGDVDTSVCWSAGDLAFRFTWWPESTVRRRLRALRDEGRVVEVAGPRGSLWRLP